MFSAILRRLYWRVIGSPVERAENWRRKQRDRVPLSAIRSHVERYRDSAEVRVRRAHEAISRELLDLQRARHTLAASNVVALKKGIA